jgi:hypothetical protein
MTIILLLSFHALLSFGKFSTSSQLDSQDIRIGTDFDQLSKFFPLDDRSFAIIQWGIPSRLGVYSIETGKEIGELSISDNTLDSIEEVVIGKYADCDIVPYNNYVESNESRISYECMFFDNGTTFVGWQMKVFIKDGESVSEDFVAVLSVLEDELVGHQAILPGERQCLDGTFFERYMWRFGHGIWNDSLFLLRDLTNLEAESRFYDVRPVNDPDKLMRRSDYRFSPENDLFWLKSSIPKDMCVSYAYSIVNDGEDVLCNTGRDANLYYFDSRKPKYTLDADAFGTLWSLSKVDGKLFLTNTKRVDKKWVLA